MASTSILLVTIEMNSARSRADKRPPDRRHPSGGAVRGEWFGGIGAQKLCLERADMSGHGRKMQRGKTAIGKFDRVAFCPPAGHLTSSYWAARHPRMDGSRPVRGDRNLSRSAGFAASEPVAGKTLRPLDWPLPAPPSLARGQDKLVPQEACASRLACRDVASE